MYIYTIDFEYFYKNAPETIREARMIAPVATSTEARIYFWYHLGLVDNIEWSESVRIIRCISAIVSERGLLMCFP